MSGSGYRPGGRRIDPDVARRAVRYRSSSAVPLETRGSTMAHEWIESDWPDDPEPMCKWCRLSKTVVGDDDCVGPSLETMIEEIGDVYVGVTDGRWWAIADAGCAICHAHAHQRHRHGWTYVEGHDDPAAAVSALYAAWRERE